MTFSGRRLGLVIRVPMMGFHSPDMKAEGTGRGSSFSPDSSLYPQPEPPPSPGALESRRQVLSSQPAGRKAAHPSATAWELMQLSICPQGNPRLTEDFVAHLETELEQSRLREMETLGALREMQDKVLDMEKVQLGNPVFGRFWGREGGVMHALKEVHNQS